MTTPTFDPGFGTPELSARFSAGERLRSMLRVEVALAECCADVGLTTRDIADEIARVCSSTVIDADRILAEGWNVGTPVLALLDVIRAELSPDASRAISFGATTQDIVDTAGQLQVQGALGCITADLLPLARRLAELAAEHRATPMIGRTFLQHALPTTLGLRVAQWFDAVATHLTELDVAAGRCAIQLGGPVGALEDFPDRSDISGRLAARLGLIAPVTSWHGDRSRVVGQCALAGAVARAMAKIATDIALLSSSEIGEVSVRSGGSSSMAGKRNPIDAVHALAAADACVGAVNTVMTTRPVELERGVGGWHLEWFAVPVVFMTCGAAVAAVRNCIDSLEVDAAAMMRNLGGRDTESSTSSAARIADRILAAHDLPARP